MRWVKLLRDNEGNQRLWFWCQLGIICFQIGPEKGAIHLATAAIVNALWDLWGRYEGKPVWKLLVDLPPEKLVSTIDFRYM